MNLINDPEKINKLSFRKNSEKCLDFHVSHIKHILLITL